MNKFLSSGLVFLSGIVCSPVATTLADPQVPAVKVRQDPRQVALKTFFGNRDCPAGSLAHVFIAEADRHSLDWRLLPGISMVESTGGKHARNNNLFGWASGKASFISMSHAIHVVASNLANSPTYRAKSVDAMLETYNPNSNYAHRVKAVMRLIAASPALAQ